MANKSLVEKSAGMPVPLLPTMVGAVTLSNIYAGNFGFTWVRHITIFFACIVWIFALIKIVTHFDTFKKEYHTTVPCSLYGGFTMLMMLFGAYLFPYTAPVGKAIWFVGVILHILHILAFTYLHVIKSFKIETFVPSWFVTYVAITVAVVVGGSMNEPVICKWITYYAISLYIILSVTLIYRLATKPLNAPLLHTKAIFLAPASLCFVGYMNVYPKPNNTIAMLLYIGVLIAFFYFLKNIPAFFAVPFAPGFAGLTFPNAIGVVASFRMAGYLSETKTFLSSVVLQLAGIQMYITTAVIAFVVYNFYKIIAASYQA